MVERSTAINNICRNHNIRRNEFQYDITISLQYHLILHFNPSFSINPRLYLMIFGRTVSPGAPSLEYQNYSLSVYSDTGVTFSLTSSGSSGYWYATMIRTNQMVSRSEGRRVFHRKLQFININYYYQNHCN